MLKEVIDNEIDILLISETKLGNILSESGQFRGI